MFEDLRHLADGERYSDTESALLRQQRETARQAAAQHTEDTGIWGGVSAANRSGFSGTFLRAGEEVDFRPQPGWRLPEDVAKRWQAKGIDSAQWELFERAHSDEHLEWLESIALQNQEDAYTLSEFGFWGNLGLGMTDVGGLAIDVIAAPIGYASKAGRIGNALRSGAVAAGATAGMMAGMSYYNPEITLKDGVQASALAFALGGAFGARRGHLYHDTINPDAVKRAAGMATGDGTLSATQRSDIVPDVDPTPGAHPLRPDRPAEELLLDRAMEGSAIQPHFSRIRIDLAARMGKAKSSVVREAGRILFREGVGYTDRNIAVAESTSEFAKRHLATLETKWRRGFNEAEYKKAHNIKFYDFNARKQFNIEVGRAVRGETDGISQEALKAAESVRHSLKDALQLAKDQGLDGFAPVGENARYLPRYWNAHGFQKLFGELYLDEKTVLQGLIKPALRKAWEARDAVSIDDEMLDAVATAYIKRAQKHAEGDTLSQLHTPLNQDDVAELGKMLNEAGVPESRSRDLLTRYERNAREAGKLDRAKKRVDLDENFTARLVNERGEEVTVKASDLFDNDVESVLSRYMREITGWAALSNKANIKNRAQLDMFENQVLVEARKAGDKEADIKRMLDIGINTTFGRSTEIAPNSRASRYGRFIRNWNFSRVMNQVGFTMFAELGPVIAHSGVRNVIRSIPEIPAMLKRGRDGSLSSKEAQIMEDLFAPGTDLIRNPPFLRLDDDGSVVQPTFDRAPWADKALMGANHVTNVLSGMAPITAILQRLAGRATLLRMMEMAKAHTLRQGDIDRLRTWGLDEAGQQQVFAYLKTVNKIEEIDPSALPLETRERLSALMYRITRHQVLEADASDSIEAMHGVAGRLILQFRTFMFNSYTRHFLNSAHHWNEWGTYQMLALSTAFAGMGWAARAWLNTIGEPEKRERLLTPANFAKNAVAQSSWASFIPMVTDVVMGDMLHREPVFQGNRSTGLQNSVMGIPALDLATKALASTGMIGSLLSADEHITEEQMTDFWRIWWFSNLSGVRNIAEAGIGAVFPDKPDGTNRE